MGTVLHPESGSHSSHPRTGNAEAALSETDIPEAFFLPAKTCQWEAGCQNHICFPLSPAVADLLGNGCHCQKIIIVIGGLASHQRLPPGSAHIEFSIVLQDILHGIRLVIIPGEPCREAHMGSFDGIISMIDSYNDKSPHPFWFSCSFPAGGLLVWKKKKGRTPKSPARNKKYSYAYLQINTHNCIPLILNFLINAVTEH